MKTNNVNSFFLLIAGLTVFLILFNSCDTTNTDSDGETEIIDTVNVDLPASSGEIGLVINTREIFRKGYTASVADVTFPGYSDFNQTLDIHAVTNVAVLIISNDDLTEEQKNAFANGVAVIIDIFDQNGMVLAEFQDNEQVLDDTNFPLTIHTELEKVIPPVTLQEEIAYLLQPKDHEDGSIVRALGFTDFTIDIPETEDITSAQEFYFEPVDGKANTYKIKRFGSVSGPYFFENNNGWIILDGNGSSVGAQEFVIDQEQDGWIRFRKEGTEEMYMSLISTDNDRKRWGFVSNATDRFRLITLEIDWNATDRGTEFSRSVVPPAEIEFAYQATIRNCSSGILTEQVGVTKSRTSVTKFQTTESLQLFASAEISVGITTKAEVGVSVPAVGDVSAGVELSSNLSLTTSATTTSENTLTNEISETSEVSRIRTLEVPPFTGIEVYDAVRVIKNARVPFTQVLRLKADYTNGPPLSGDEIMTQMLFNFVDAMPLAVGADYVDIGIAGNVGINEMFETETGANEVTDACD